MSHESVGCMFISEKPKPLEIIANLSFANSGIPQGIENMLMKFQKPLKGNLLVSMILKNKDNEPDMINQRTRHSLQTI